MTQGQVCPYYESLLIHLCLCNAFKHTIHRAVLLRWGIDTAQNCNTQSALFSSVLLPSVDF